MKQRISIHLTSREINQIDTIAHMLKNNRSQVLSKTLETYVSFLSEPPEPIKKALQEQAEEKRQIEVTGYLCERGHPFFLEFVWPGQPHCCPACGNSNIKCLWSGIAKKGF